MDVKKIYVFFSLFFVIFFGFSNFANAALTLGATSVGSSGAITLTGSGASTWDIGNNTLSLQTANNGAITTGSGTLTLGGNLSLPAGTIQLVSPNNGIVIGIVSGNSRGLYSIDISPIRNDVANVASGLYSTVIGQNSTASATYATALGYNDSALNSYSGAWGYGNSVGGGTGATYTLGYSNTINGTSGYSIALGSSNTLAGLYSTTLGYNNALSNNYTLALGHDNTVTSTGGIAIGSNITNGTDNSLMIGPSNSAKVTILSTGFTGILNSQPQSQLEVGDPTNGTNEFMQIDSINGAPQASECNSNSGRGRMIHDYTNHRLYICDGVSRSWDHIDLVD